MPVHQTVSKKCKLSRRFSDYKITSPLAIHRNGRTKLRYHVDENEKSSKAPISSILSRVPDKPTAAGDLNFFHQLGPYHPPSLSMGDAFSLGSKAIWLKFVFTISLVFPCTRCATYAAPPLCGPIASSQSVCSRCKRVYFSWFYFFNCKPRAAKKEKNSNIFASVSVLNPSV